MVDAEQLRKDREWIDHVLTSAARGSINYMFCPHSGKIWRRYGLHDTAQFEPDDSEAGPIRLYLTAKFMPIYSENLRYLGFTQTGNTGEMICLR